MKQNILGSQNIVSHHSILSRAIVSLNLPNKNLLILIFFYRSEIQTNDSNLKAGI